ncbi:ParB/RepB/Spo0J family partition protein [Bifidobacterium scaligerum]|uniref:Chromosome partitioning protein ParB n=1 Tax=Bifidobacterium scaligerum TaxID=2052656 RepID=A0A2M9HSH2_9BIFI|nr:ParB/RepB/Spo0J family partition protein [Bifidobacterium scaligerum]PJM79742.1 chromosome partitioning protein ParB [Bifidobacterium scaligerum]
METAIIERPVSADEGMEESNIVMLDVGLIDPNPANPRRDVGDVSELADSIRAQGIRQNLLVTPTPQGRYLLVIGHRLLAAAKLAGLSWVPAVVADLSEREQRELMLVENSQRADLTVIEEADGYQGLLDLGVGVDEAAQRTGRSTSLVRRRLKIAAIGENVRSKAGTAQLSIDDWETIADFDRHPDLQERLAEAAGGKNWNMAVKHARQERTWREWLDTARAELERMGIDAADEQPNADNWYDSPKGLRRTTMLTTGDIAKAIDAWRDSHDGATPVVGVRAEGASWARGIALYETVDEEAETAAREAREARWREEREREERETAPAKEFARASRDLRIAFVTHLMELKSQPKGIGKAVALLSARFALDTLTEGFDQWNSHAEDVWEQITGIGTAGDDADDAKPEDEAEDPLRESVTAMIAGDPQRAAFGLLYALAEERVSWETWRDAATIAEHAAPLYEALETLGYRTSDTEAEALNGSLVPIDDDDNGEDTGIGQDSEPDDDGASQADDASGEPDDAE